MKILREEEGIIYLEVPVKVRQIKDLGCGESKTVFGDMLGLPVHFLSSEEDREQGNHVAHDFQVDPFSSTGTNEKYEIVVIDDNMTVFDNENRKVMAAFNIEAYGRNDSLNKAQAQREFLYESLVENLRGQTLGQLIARSI